MNILKQDIKRIGLIEFSTEDGYLSIICDAKTFGIEYMILREWLILYGGGAEITHEGDYIHDDGYCDWQFITNLKWAEYVMIVEEE